jgi:hypothetical protein
MVNPPSQRAAGAKSSNCPLIDVNSAPVQLNRFASEPSFIRFSALEKIVLDFAPLDTVFYGQYLAEQSNAQGSVSIVIPVVVKIHRRTVIKTHHRSSGGVIKIKKKEL